MVERLTRVKVRAFARLQELKSNKRQRDFGYAATQRDSGVAQVERNRAQVVESVAAPI